MALQWSDETAGKLHYICIVVPFNLMFFLINTDVYEESKPQVYHIITGSLIIYILLLNLFSNTEFMNLCCKLNNAWVALKDE